MLSPEKSAIAQKWRKFFYENNCWDTAWYPKERNRGTSWLGLDREAAGAQLLKGPASAGCGTPFAL
jgi:hypothetical protein